jgi:hypothetical protein
LQYYFTDKAALIRELLVELTERPEDGSAAAPSGESAADRDRQFLAFIDRMLEDGRSAIFKGLLLQFWALSCNDESVARSMEVAHSQYGRAMGVAIRRLNSDLDEPTIKQRSRVIRCLVEGTIFASQNRDGVLCPPAGLYKRVRREALRVAKRGPPPVRSTRASRSLSAEPPDER